MHTLIIRLSSGTKVATVQENIPILDESDYMPLNLREELCRIVDATVCDDRVVPLTQVEVKDCQGIASVAQGQRSSQNDKYAAWSDDASVVKSEGLVRGRQILPLNQGRLQRGSSVGESRGIWFTTQDIDVVVPGEATSSGTIARGSQNEGGGNQESQEAE